MLIGIDLGTTFSAAAHVNKDGNAEIIVNRDGDRVTPSVVMFEDGSAIVGEQAKENSVINPFAVCQFVKRQMGKKSFFFDVSGSEHYTAEEISAMILKRLKEDAEDASGEKVSGAVITVPAYFDDAQRKATQDAGAIAGLNVLGIINEPTAAALAYCHGQANSDGNILVFDLGGGTFDITIMKLSNGLKNIDILATTGMRNMGGFDFDNEIISKIVAEFQNKYGIDLEEDDLAAQDLRLKAENAKKALSARQKTSISIVSGGKALKMEITRDEFNNMIQEHLNRMQAYMEMAMDDASLQWKDISKILLVGGSTRIPAVQEMIQQVSGIVPSHELNPDEAVALGAAYYAESIGNSGSPASKANQVKISDVTSHSLGIITLDERQNYERFVMSKLIRRNTPIPAFGEDVFYLTHDGQYQISVNVAEGEDENPDYDTIIGTSEITFEPKQKGYPIHILMSCDINGIVHVNVKDGVTEKDMGEFKIERKANLSDDDIANKKDIIDGLTID